MIWQAMGGCVFEDSLIFLVPCVVAKHSCHYHEYVCGKIIMIRHITVIVPVNHSWPGHFIVLIQSG